MKKVIERILEKGICQSCKIQSTKIMEEYADELTGLHLCELCQPWVMTSRNVPKEVNGIQIEDEELFIRMFKEVEGIKEPENDTDWGDLFHKILPNKSKYLQKIKTYHTIRNDWWNEYDYYEILEEIVDYRDGISSMEEEYRGLLDEGWHDYANQIDWERHGPLVIGSHKIIIKPCLMDFKKPVFEVDGISLGENIRRISNGLLADLIFDSIMSTNILHDSLEIFSRIEYTMRCSPIHKFPLTISFLLQLLGEIIIGEMGKELQYKVLAMNYRWSMNVDPSRNFFFRDKDVWARAFLFLREIIAGLESDAIIEAEGILVKGISGIWYTIRPCRWGAPWSVGIVGRGPLCIGMLRGHMFLPIGDQLASVVLSLRNDLDVLQHITTLIPYMSEENRPEPLEVYGDID